MKTMNLQEELRNALTNAMKSGQVQRKSTLRLALAAIKNAEIDARGEIDDDKVISLLQKEVKARHETIEGAKQAQRPDLISKAEEEIAILSDFMPQPLSQEELRVLVQESISESGASSMADIGKVMGVLMPKIRGKADGKDANQILRELLGEG